MNAVEGSGNPKDQQRLERRFATRAIDTYSSSSIGGFLYLVAWLPIIFVTGVQESHPVACVAISIIFLLLAILRLRYRPPEKVGLAQRRWLNRYTLLVLCSAAIWTAIQVWIVIDPAIEPLAKSVSLFGTVAFCTVLAHLYTSSLRLSVSGILMLIVPTLVALWSIPDLYLLAIAITFFAGYLATAITQSQRDYHRRLELAEALLEQRDRYELLSGTDELTGLCNRRRFAETLNAQVRKLLSSPGPALTLMLLDIDHFKSINDRHGHIIGDEALKHFAQRLRGAFNEPNMLVARTGGEEFALVASGMDEELALVRADSFRISMAAEALQIAGLQIPMTVSIGLGLFNAELHRNDDGFYGAVDVALYAAKQQGRNRVVSVSMLDPSRSRVEDSLATHLDVLPEASERHGSCLS